MKMIEFFRGDKDHKNICVICGKLFVLKKRRTICKECFSKKGGFYES